jgi:hypothetical protein
MISHIPRFCAWLCLGGVIFFTVGPIEFRPELIRGEPEMDRFVAYFALAALFAWS